MRFVRAASTALVVLLLATACGTTPAPDFRGKWREVNAIDAQPRAIPLRPLQRFNVLPSDRSLKDVLERWARESGRRVSYRAAMNYSVHLDATKVTATGLGGALEQLQRTYSAQAIGLKLQGGLIIVTGGAPPALATRDAIDVE